MAAVNDELKPLQAAYEVERKRADELNEVRRKIDDLKVKADDAERRCVASPRNFGPVQHL
jgi:ATP-dependent Clp protease ATP-binding subunit ClpB